MRAPSFANKREDALACSASHDSVGATTSPHQLSGWMSDFIFNCSLRDSSRRRARSICWGIWAGSVLFPSHPRAMADERWNTCESRGNIPAPRCQNAKKQPKKKNVPQPEGQAKVQPGSAKFNTTAGPAALEHSCIQKTQTLQNNQLNP